MQRLGIVSIMLLLAGLAAVVLAKPPQVEHGRYLVENVAMCIECHTPRNTRGELDRTKLLRGAPIPVQSPFRDQKWAFRAPNIAGVPGWTIPDTVRFLETGRRASGIAPKPPMPNYKMTRADAEAVVAYLKSVR